MKFGWSLKSIDAQRGRAMAGSPSPHIGSHWRFNTGNGWELGGGSGETGAFSTVQPRSPFLAGSSFGDVPVIGIKTAVIPQTPAAIVVEHRFFRDNRVSCVHVVSYLFLPLIALVIRLGFSLCSGARTLRAPSSSLKCSAINVPMTRGRYYSNRFKMLPISSVDRITRDGKTIHNS